MNRWALISVSTVARLIYITIFFTRNYALRHRQYSAWIHYYEVPGKAVELLYLHVYLVK